MKNRHRGNEPKSRCTNVVAILLSLEGQFLNLFIPLLQGWSWSVFIVYGSTNKGLEHIWSIWFVVTGGVLKIVSHKWVVIDVILLYIWVMVSPDRKRIVCQKYWDMQCFTITNYISHLGVQHQISTTVNIAYSTTVVRCNVKICCT